MKVEVCMHTRNYEGWGNFLSPTGKFPLDHINKDLQSIKNEKYIVYHLKNNHAGETRLEMAYCIDAHGVINNNRCNENGKKINVKKIFVITK